MNEYTGIVSKVNERDWGSKVIYSWQLKGSSMWFRTDAKPNITEGSAIVFSGESPNKIDYDSITGTSVEAVKQAVEVQAKETKNVPPTTSPDYWRWKQINDLERQEAFDWRDARADATRIICAALDNDILALGNVKGKRLDLLIGMVEEVTNSLLRKKNNNE